VCAIHSLVVRFGFGQTIYVVCSCAALLLSLWGTTGIPSEDFCRRNTHQCVCLSPAPLFRRRQRTFPLSSRRSYYLGRREPAREREAFRAEGVLLVVWARVYAVERALNTPFAGCAPGPCITARDDAPARAPFTRGTSGSAPFARTEKPVSSFYSPGNGLFTNCSCRYRPR
jgi:hypothetical protein